MPALSQAELEKKIAELELKFDTEVEIILDKGIDEELKLCIMTRGSRKEHLLKAFNKTCKRLKEPLASRGLAKLMRSKGILTVEEYAEQLEGLCATLRL